MLLSKLEKRVIDISYKHKLSHLSSCLTALPLIDNIYKVMKKGDVFILSNGHAGLALYVVLEKNNPNDATGLVKGIDAEELFNKHGVHPNRNEEDGIYCSTGSLGSGICVAVGMAIADPTRDVFVLMSDGECAEGSVWEALRIAGELRLENLKIMVNANGTGAYGRVETDLLDTRLQMFFPCLVVRTDMYRYPDYLQSVDGHYHTLTDEEYKDLITLK